MNKQTFCKCIILGSCLTLLFACKQQGSRVDLGNLETGATVSFVRATGGQWGIEITDSITLKLMQQKPVQIEVFRSEQNMHQLAVGYLSLKKETNSVIGKAKLAGASGAKFDVEDRWTISG